MRHFLATIVVLSLVPLLSGCGGPVACLAIPTCGANETSGAPCQPGEANCRTVSICSSTIHCRPGSADGGP